MQTSRRSETILTAFCKSPVHCALPDWSCVINGLVPNGKGETSFNSAGHDPVSPATLTERPLCYAVPQRFSPLTRLPQLAWCKLSVRERGCPGSCWNDSISKPQQTQLGLVEFGTVSTYAPDCPRLARNESVADHSRFRAPTSTFRLT